MRASGTPASSGVDHAYQRLKRPALRRARRWFPSLGRQDLEDLYQSAWLSVMRTQSEIADLEAYLYGAVYSQGLMELRGRRRKPVDSLDRAIAAKSATPNSSGDSAGPEGAVDRTAPLPDEQAETRALSALVEEVLDALTPREARVVKMRWGWDLSREEIAGLLGTSQRAVKRDLATGGSKIAAQVESVGSQTWCRRKRSLITGYALQLLGPARAASAERHLQGCSACRLLVRELRSRAGEVAALVPAPALAEPPIHGPLRVVESFEGARAQAADVASSAKHNAASLTARASDPTPLSGARPGTAAAAIAGCLAVGGGATYCVERGVDPVSGIAGLAAEHRDSTRPRPPATTPPPEQPPDPPDLPGGVSPTLPRGGASEPGQAGQPAEPKPPPPPPPAPETEFEPSGLTNAAEPGFRPRASSSPRKPAPARAADPGEFGGP